MAKAKKRSPTKRATTARRHSAAAPALLGLTSDWYWEQDAALRFTRVEVRNDAAAEQELAKRILGKKRWQTGVEIEGGWDAHRAILKSRPPPPAAPPPPPRGGGSRCSTAAAASPAIAASAATSASRSASSSSSSS